jgi:hypothetical protein
MYFKRSALPGTVVCVIVPAPRRLRWQDHVSPQVQEHSETPSQEKLFSLIKLPVAEGQKKGLSYMQKDVRYI